MKGILTLTDSDPLNGCQLFLNEILFLENTFSKKKNTFVLLI